MESCFIVYTANTQPYWKLPTTKSPPPTGSLVCQPASYTTLGRSLSTWFDSSLILNAPNSQVNPCGRCQDTGGRERGHANVHPGLFRGPGTIVGQEKATWGRGTGDGGYTCAHTHEVGNNANSFSFSILYKSWTWGGTSMYRWNLPHLTLFSRPVEGSSELIYYLT